MVLLINHDHCLFLILSENTQDSDDKKVVAEITARRFVPASVTTTSWEEFRFVGHEIRISEAVDCYGAVVWPSVPLHTILATSPLFSFFVPYFVRRKWFHSSILWPQTTLNLELTNLGKWFRPLVRFLTCRVNKECYLHLWFFVIIGV